MSQNDMVIANSNGATVRADINSALQALASSNGGATAPSTTYANQFWFDTVNDILKIRDEANANWVNTFSLVGTTWIPYSNGSVLGTLANLNAASISTSIAMAADKSIAGALTAVSSGTPNFAAMGNAVSLSGTATANTLGTVQAGFVGVIHYGIPVTVTHNATSRILPGGTNVNWVAGDVEIVLSLGSGNWRTVGYSLATGRALTVGSYSTKTTSYTVTDADNGGFIRFSGLAADVTCSLPAASGRTNFVVTIINDDTNDTTGFGVVIDPNASEQIDGQLSRKTYSTSRVTLVCDGTGWRTVAGHYRYFSGDQTITTNTTLALTHLLGVKPKKVWAELKCTTADAGYAVGDIIPAPIWGDNSNVNSQSVPQYDASSINVVFSATAQVFWTLNKSTRGQVNLTNANWKLRVYAEE